MEFRKAQYVVGLDTARNVTLNRLSFEILLICKSIIQFYINELRLKYLSLDFSLKSISIKHQYIYYLQ